MAWGDSDFLDSDKFPQRGKMVVEPMPIHGVGTFALFQDPDGVMIGLFEEKVPQAQPWR